MELQTLLTSSVIAILWVQMAKDLLGKISNRWGATMAQFSLLVASFAIAGVGALVGVMPPEFVETTMTIFVSAISVYEILYKNIYLKVIKNKGDKSKAVCPNCTTEFSTK